jgi:hypothetical protein
MTKGRTSIVKNDEIRGLALELLQADSESEVISLLRAASLWEDPAAWRLYGDKETNYATIGNQQSRPEAALVEKIVNAVDARLLGTLLHHDMGTALRTFNPGAVWVVEEVLWNLSTINSKRPS